MSNARKLSAALAPLLAAVLAAAAVAAYFYRAMPPYTDHIGNVNHNEKIKGVYLVAEAAKRGDTVTVFGSSELAMTEIPTHPGVFFAGGRGGFYVNVVGRGSCQSLIHALAIAASGQALSGQKVVLITSPQSYVPQGISPDLFMANFSPQQLLAALEAGDISAGAKQALAARAATLLARYEASAGSAPAGPAIGWLAEHTANPTPATSARNFLLTPYYAASRRLLDLKDRAASRALLLREGRGEAPASASGINWAAEEEAAVAAARQMATNNEFGMLDDYYTTNIGTRLQRFAGRDSTLSYSQSEEYGDLRLLLEICRQKGIEPLFVHVPLHGQWSDYTGFPAGKRQEYYENVRAIVEEYGVELLDLTAREYDEYFMCDVMHLGWKGWLEVDRAISDYYHGR